MKVLIGAEARQDLERLSDVLKEEILSAIQSLAENPVPENSYVIYLPDGNEIQCLKLQEMDRNSRLNHRVTYDIVDAEFIRVYGVFARAPGYERIKEKTAERRTS